MTNENIKDIIPEKKEVKPFAYRIPVDLKEQLEKTAKEKNISVNTAINYIIANYFEKQS